ncbi:MAG: cobalamin-binding protein, partial [Clostridiales bacterium]|nr:cobalamin-binding protein [Clostridiales bacterium]
ALLSLDRIKAGNIIDNAAVSKKPVSDQFELIAQALNIIGEGWDSGKYSLAQVYMSGVICEELADKLLPEKDNKRISSPRLSIAVLFDQHALGKRMVKSVLLSGGYEVNDLGQGLGVDELVDKAINSGTEILLISTLMLTSALKIALVTEKLNTMKTGIKVIAGGAPFRFDPCLWTKVGAAADGRNATDIIGVVESVVNSKNE